MCLQQNDFSILHQLVRHYQTFVASGTESKIYGMKLKNQSWSHMILVKYIAAALAF